MAVSANVLRVSTTLRLGERVLVRCDDGLLVTEYVLFDPTDIVLRATDPVTVRETGYITTAADALERLARAGVTPALARRRPPARCLPMSSRRSGGRVRSGRWRRTSVRVSSSTARCTARSARPTKERGSTCDRSRSRSSEEPRGHCAPGAVHLAAALHEVAPSTPLHLSTANATRDRRPGERTHRRVRSSTVLRSFPTPCSG